jgi:hypothetical protein
MIVDPNVPINTRVRTIMLHKGIIHFIDGTKLPVIELTPNNKLEQYCADLDPNTDYIDILLPDDSTDRNDYFLLVAKCREYNDIHAQSVIRKAESIWNYWEQLQMQN